MEQVSGKSILGGVAMGPLHFYHRVPVELVRQSDQSPEVEWERFRCAQERSRRQLEQLYNKALAEAGEETAAILEIHQMMLEDEDYVEAIETAIREKAITAEYAVSTVGENFSAAFAAMDDEYMNARAVDVKDISQRLINTLLGTENGAELDRPVILVAEDLTPSETVQMDKSKLLGFVTQKGSANSHNAILARTMNIPALIGVDISESWDGREGIIDGYTGTLYIDPAQTIRETMGARFQADLDRFSLLQTLRGEPNVTQDGREIHVFANIGSLEDLELVEKNDSGGVGLFRSEFLYLDSTDYPDENRQFAVYKQVAQALAGKKVIIRTLDIGADKQADYFGLEKEENPALGYRAIRICLTRPQVFKTQLRAILRAAAYGQIAVMFPMITALWELQQAKELLEECCRELSAESIPFGPVEVGIMVETPAAVMLADELAQEVSFFSIGTNDLTQYTLAIDRQNPRLDRFYDSHHPALIKMIQQTVEAGHRHGCWVGICGELGADLSLTETFLRMGLDELSVTPTATLPLRQKIRELNLGQE